MATMQVELVSPERQLASLEAESVLLPGADGEFTAMPGHVPVVTALSPGRILIKNGSDDTEYLIAGGFAEVSGAGVSVLAEFASLKGEATADLFASSLESAEAVMRELEATDDKDALAEAVRRHGTLKTMMDGLGA